MPRIFTRVMQNSDFYSDAHLVAAAIRILIHKNSTPPSIDEICQTLSFSLEQGNFICKKLKDKGIIEIVEGAFGTRLFLNNHLKIEELSKGKKADSLEDAVKNFQSSRKDMTQKAELFRAEQEKKQKDLFAELEKKLKKGLGP